MIVGLCAPLPNRRRPPLCCQQKCSMSSKLKLWLPGADSEQGSRLDAFRGWAMTVFRNPAGHPERCERYPAVEREIAMQLHKSLDLPHGPWDRSPRAAGYWKDLTNRETEWTVWNGDSCAQGRLRRTQETSRNIGSRPCLIKILTRSSTGLRL
jgi:hypothetical protein